MPGFPWLKWTRAGNRFDPPPGWGIIGTHVSPLAARRGVGARLFEITLEAARTAGLERIEALIAETNLEGQAYCENMGLRSAEGAVCKCFRVT